MDDFLDLRRLHNARCYFTAIVIFASIYLFGVLLFDLLQVQIYRHDALYYRSLDEYLYNVKTVAEILNFNLSDKGRVLFLPESDSDVNLTLIIGRDYRSVKPFRLYLANL